MTVQPWLLTVAHVVTVACTSRLVSLCSAATILCIAATTVTSSSAVLRFSAMVFVCKPGPGVIVPALHT